MKPQECAQRLQERAAAKVSQVLGGPFSQNLLLHVEAERVCSERAREC